MNLSELVCEILICFIGQQFFVFNRTNFVTKPPLFFEIKSLHPQICCSWLKYETVEDTTDESYKETSYMLYKKEQINMD